MTVGNLDFGQTEIGNAAVGGLLGAMVGLHSGAAAGALTLLPPTMDLTSALTTTQQQAYFMQFNSALLMAFEQLGERTMSTSLASAAQQAVEAGAMGSLTL